MASLVETGRPWKGTPVLREAILATLREHPDGLTTQRLAVLLDRKVASIRTHLDTMYARGALTRVVAPGARMPKPPFLWKVAE
jgi:predicted ArsR family transcriptional regulator